MIVTAYNAQEIILGLIALAGEIPKPNKLREQFQEDYEIKSSTLGKTVSVMKKSDLVSARKGFDAVRIKSPEGISRLKAYSTELFLHYMLISNAHKIPTGNAKRNLIRRNQRTVMFLYRAGAYIDNLRVAYEPNDFGKLEKDEERRPPYFANEDGKVFMLPDLTRQLPEGGMWFYSSKIIKDTLNEQNSKRITLSKAQGILCANGNTLPVFFVESPEANCIRTTENALKILTQSVHRNAYGKESEERQRLYHPNGQGIFLMENLEDIKGFVEKKNRKKYFDPNALYGEYYILPPDKRGNPVLHFITSKNWEHKIIDNLYYEDEITPEDLSDGILDGLPSWEFMTSNFRKIEYIRKSGSRRVRLICYPWQQEILESILTDIEVEFMLMDDKSVRELEEAVCE